MKRVKRRGKKKGYAGLLITAFALILMIIYGISKLPDTRQSEDQMSSSLMEMLPAPIQKPLPLIIQPELKYEIEESLDINSSNAILLRLDGDSEVLYEKSSAERIYPASLTKIMTAVVVIESLKDLNKKVLLSEEMYSYLKEENASVAGFLKNEEVPAVDLLYGVLLPSGAECCIGLAEYIAGSEAGFVKLMNKKAQKLGMRNTNFVNTTGLHDDNHYSTVSDMAVLLEYALDIETFYEIFITPVYSSNPTNLHIDGITFSSTMFWLMERIGKIESADFTGGKILGGKTGYTDEAGQCLASIAEKDGGIFMLVTCGAPGDYRTQILHIDDAFTVYGMITYKFYMVNNR